MNAPERVRLAGRILDEAEEAELSPPLFSAAAQAAIGHALTALALHFTSEGRDLAKVSLQLADNARRAQDLERQLRDAEDLIDQLKQEVAELGGPPMIG